MGKQQKAVCAPTVSAMLQCSTEELAGLYATGKPAPVPVGPTRGTGLYFPGTWFTRVFAPVLPLGWSGKKFDSDGGIVDRLLPGGILRLIHGEAVSNATSAIDGRKCILLDRSQKSLWPWTEISDEMRLVAPDLYLGPVLAFGKSAPIWFTLEPIQPKKD